MPIVKDYPYGKAQKDTEEQIKAESEKQRRKKIALRLSGLWIAIFIAAVIAMVVFGPLITAIAATVIAGASFIVFLAFEIRDWWRGRKRSFVDEKNIQGSVSKVKKTDVFREDFKSEPTLEDRKAPEQKHQVIIDWSRHKESVYVNGGLISDIHPGEFTIEELKSFWQKNLFIGFDKDEKDKMTRFFLTNMDSNGLMFMMKGILNLVAYDKGASLKASGYPSAISVLSEGKKIFVEETCGITEVYFTSDPLSIDENTPSILVDQYNPVVTARLNFVISFSESGVPTCSLREVHPDFLREDQVERLTEKLMKEYEESLISEHIMDAASAKKLAATYKQELKREYQKNLGLLKSKLQPEEITKKVQETLDRANSKFIEAQNVPASSPSLSPLP